MDPNRVYFKSTLSMLLCTNRNQQGWPKTLRNIQILVLASCDLTIISIFGRSVFSILNPAQQPHIMLCTHTESRCWVCSRVDVLLAACGCFSQCCCCVGVTVWWFTSPLAKWTQPSLNIPKNLHQHKTASRVPTMLVQLILADKKKTKEGSK